MTRRTASLGAVVLAIVVAGAGPGCKSDDKDPGTAFIADYCSLYKPCCAAAGLPDDGKVCEDLFASTRPPNAVFDAASAGHCISGLQQLAGQPGFCEGELPPPSSCARAFGGGDGAVCIQDGDCPPSDQGDARCISGGTQTPRCQIQARGQLDSAPCVGDIRGGVVLYSGTISGEVPDLGYLCDTADGLRCDTSATGACVALVEVGASCVLSSDCVPTTFCDGGTGLCATRKPVGAACLDPAGECEDGAFCDLGNMVCAAQADVGGTCTENVQCLTGNCPDGTCQPTPPVGPNALCGG